MEFFGLTLYGPQNYIRDLIKEGYREPECKEQVEPLMQRIISQSTCPEKIQRADVSVIRLIDCYIGRVNGFAYGSAQRFNKMKRKGVIKPTGPADIYRIPPTTSVEIGWWQCDPALANQTWHETNPRYPAPVSPTSLIYDQVRKNDKYARLF
ncbi:uncharacterized protein LOC134661518 [Cydia amplana]|uniref:uncharacterized protein LOC134661518 n=1 Tax=Cydia amplana TaxID=1869771 RepID=UPI002FE5EFAC